MNYEEITKIYREIGKKFHKLGAEQVVLLKARSYQEQEIQLSLELAVDGQSDLNKMFEQAKLCWPQVEISILDMNKNPNLMQEIAEDGIIL